MARRKDLPDDVQAETRRRRTRWLVLLAVLLVTALVLGSGHQYPLARLLATGAVFWAVVGLAWINAPARDFRKTEARIRAEEHIQTRQE